MYGPLSTSLVGGCLAALALAASALYPELRRPPEKLDPPPAPLRPLLTEHGRAITTRDAWQRRRDALRREWSGILGPLPKRTPLGTEILSTEEQPDHTRLRLRYHADPDSTVEAYLLLPKGFPGKRPGMVVLHPTTDATIRSAVGLAGRETIHNALHLVRRGYVCLAPGNFLWGEVGEPYGQVTQELLARGRYKTGMAKMLWDSIRATDVLVARPEVDPKRVGSIGHSLGGKEALYHAAFDDRIRAAISCEGGIGLSFSNWDADWYLGPQIHASSFRHDQHEVLSLVAPRAFLLIGGESADGAQSWPYVEANLPVWRLFNAEERLGLFRHPHGHDFPPPGPEREQVYGWLDHWLGTR